MEQVRNLVEARAIPYTIWSDQQGEASKAFGGVRLTPTFFVLDANARIRYQHIGEFDTERVDRLLERLTS
ncbi:MAG TPA: redoxin domain-containing protein [Halothiobacillaceae bacterium]|nr:redoxin domain-containing protein [Halothiobacillaceae bacterium]